MLDFPLAAPIHALPLEIMRVLGGSVLFVYFLQAFRQAADFSDPDGLIDHGLTARLFPPTRISLFQPGMPAILIRIMFLCACIASLFVLAGYHARASAVFLFLVAASTYRWNVLVAYLDDAMVHIFCLWLALLPVGHTLTLADLTGNPAPAGEWLAATVPGTTPRAFMANMALVYIVAGLYKFTSPMWRNGSAMHAALKMPIAHTPRFWTMRHRALLRTVTYAALVLEPLFALIFILPPNSTLKWLLLGAAMTFHLGIVATLKISYSNAVMAAALPLAFTPEIMQMGLGAPPPEALEAAGLAPTEVIALTLVALLAIMSALQAARAWVNLPAPGKPYSGRGWENPVRALLWLVGIFQSYRLFDWVDARNYHIRYEVRRIASDAGKPANPHWHDRADVAEFEHVDPGALFPGTMRHLLLQSYLVGNIWLQMGPGRLTEIRRSLLFRHARRYARAHPDAGTMEAVAVVQRITDDNLDLTRGERQLLMRFTCQGGQAVMLHPR